MALAHEKLGSQTGKLVLLTGATGCVGRRLLGAMADRWRVRCLVRRSEAICAMPEAANVEVMAGDMLDRTSVVRALEGVDVAYYLVHSMNSPSSFEARDRIAARNFAEAACAAKVRRIIYLGGLAASGCALSLHLLSRREVGDLLRQSGVQVIEFRSSMIIGARSLSFEMVRALAERLPVMITPRWVAMRAQPIALRDVVGYLAAACDLELQTNRVFEIGGADVASYGEIIRKYCRQRGLHRAMIRVPVLTPRLSSWWLRLVTPLQARVGRQLIESVRHHTVVRDQAARRVFAIKPVGIADAIAEALSDEDRDFLSVNWSRAAMPSKIPLGGVRMGSRIVVSQAIHADAPPAAAFAPIRRIGGRVGWYYGRPLWQLRAWIDRMLGGPGMRGRRDGAHLAEGDRVDFWRVQRVVVDRKLTLIAEMKVPGRAWLDFEVAPDATGSTIRQTAIFDARGLFGLLYWYISYPVHRMAFAGMLRNIAAAARGSRQDSRAQARFRISTIKVRQE